jgi:hypothetical protein
MALSKTNKLSMATGAIIGFGMIAYFLLMKMFGLNRVIELRFLNLVIIFAGVWYVISKSKKIYGELYYLHGLGLGLQASLIGAALFSAFMGFYLMKMDPEFMDFIRRETNLGDYVNPWIFAHVTFGQCFSAGAVMTFILMQYYKSEPEKKAEL